MYPTLEQCIQIASEKKFKRIPVAKELYSDSYTPVGVMRILRNSSRHCFMLESASQSEQWGRYTFLGYSPTLEITCTDGQMTIKTTTESGETLVDKKTVSHPGDTIRTIVNEHSSAVVEGLPPFTGGLVGYFSYDYIKYAEPSLKLAGDEGDFRDLDLMLFDSVIAFDNYRQKIYLITGVSTEETESSYAMAKLQLDNMADLLKNGQKKKFSPIKLISDIEPQFTEARYCEMVNKAKHALVEAHDETEVKRALSAGAEIIGVNNRNLRDFTIDMNNSIRLRKLAPDNVVFVSESGIKTNEDIERLYLNKVDAVLIGETLMRSTDKKGMLEKLNGGTLS